ncbi:DUF5715 family protein [Rubrivirga litoralis]|uniref:DUF5715 family protein n=1 Tax=Rubrivirga litoralis TaxID=3075598 RepID=A0ABU3BV99_9BACT|nr:DUF5715 family protein [Rubrivirga sp. F394]MDT0633219.1 DUF5715 family protein [Rubrivirga sp. F394]
MLTPDLPRPALDDPDEPAPPPFVREGRRTRTRPVRLVAFVALTAAVVGAGWFARRAQQGVAATYAAQDSVAAAAVAAFERVPLLTDDEIALLRRSRNARHVETAEALGVEPPATRAEVDSLVGALGLVRVQTNRLYTVLPARSSVPYLTPSAVASLDSIAVRFRGRLAEAGLPPFRFSVSSGWRTSADQAALRGRNVNAAAGHSSHEYATTYDITYNPTRYSPAPDALPPPPRVDPRVPGFLRESVRAGVAEEQRAALDRLAADYPSRLTAALGRALIDLEDDGVLITVRERRQPVFHTTVARPLVEPAEGVDPMGRLPARGVQEITDNL